MQNKFNNLDELTIYLESLEKRVKMLEEQKEIQDKKLWDLSQMAKGKYENLDLLATIEQLKNQRANRNLWAVILQIFLFGSMLAGAAYIFFSAFK